MSQITDSLSENYTKSDILLKINYNLSKNFGNVFLSDEKKNPRNKIFHDFIERKKTIHTEKINLLKNPIGDLQIAFKEPSELSPVFYSPTLTKKHISMHNNKIQNFGSDSPKILSSIQTEGNSVGPGTYFNTNYDMKFSQSLTNKGKIILGNAFPCSEDVGDLTKNIRNKNTDKNLGPGEFNLSKDFLKEDISNVKSFWSKQERFNFDKDSMDKKKGNKKKKNNFDLLKEQELTTNFDKFIINKNPRITAKVNSNNENLLNFLLKQQNKKKDIDKNEEKYIQERKIEKRKKIMNQVSPCVGEYDPDIISSIAYRNYAKSYFKSVPFNSIRPRFFKNNNVLYTEGLPGPGFYESEKAYNSLNCDTKKYKVFGANEKFRKNYNRIPGVGNYDIEKNQWSKRSFNILFMDRHNDLYNSISNNNSSIKTK